MSCTASWPSFERLSSQLRRVGHRPIEGGRARHPRVGDEPDVARRRDRRQVRREGRQLEEERARVGEGLVDERRTQAGEHVRHVVLLLLAVLARLTVDVERVVEALVGARRGGPVRPTSRDTPVAGAVAVEILAVQRGPVAPVAQPDGERLVLVAVLVERLDPPARGRVREHLRVVRQQAREDRRAARAAQRVRDDEAIEAHTLADQRLRVGHVLEQVRGQVVRQHQHDVRPVQADLSGLAVAVAAAGHQHHGSEKGEQCPAHDGQPSLDF